jgi:hypothetical protein
LVKAEEKGNGIFVVCESTDYGRKFDSGIHLGVRDLRRWFKNGHSSLTGNAQYDSIRQKIKSDTTWISLMVKLENKMSQRFLIANRFSQGLHVTIIGENAYNKIFRGDGWGRFHKKYRGTAALVDLSAVVSDGKRALFYFAQAWGGKEGNTSVIFFEKVNGKWIYFGTDRIFNF